MATRRPKPPIYTAMANGRMWDLANPSAMDVDWRAIAASLAKICRFNGATTSHYSVAQHSIIVASQLPPELRLYGLLHDAHEAVMGDITRPMREAIAHFAGPVARKLVEFEMAQMEAIHRAAGLKWPLSVEAEMAVHHADNRALATEWRDVMPECAREHLPPRPAVPPLTTVIRPTPEAKAAEAWLLALPAAFRAADCTTPPQLTLRTV